MAIALPMFDSITDVATHRLCSGCGACAAVVPAQIAMVDDENLGRVPQLTCPPTEVDRAAQHRALAVCPGIALERPAPATSRAHSNEAAAHEDLYAAWGPVYEVCEGWAADEAIRHAGSSGGAATALALFCIEQLHMAGVVHAAARDDAPWLNHTVFSTHRAELLARTGSRYAPASPCDGVHHLQQAEQPGVFIGKPCDVAALARMQREDAALANKVGLTIAFFCAGTPTLRGTLALLEKAGVDNPLRIESIRYRGNGWPGRWTVQFRDDADGSVQTRSLSYEESWGFLERFRPWRCRICPDHSGEFADIAVGDPWHRAPDGRDPGRSLIIARTPRGLALLQQAERAGYLVIAQRDPSLLERSQPALRRARRGLWGRLAIMWLLRAPMPRFNGFDLFADWMRLPLMARLRSLLGTLRRAGRYGLRRRATITPMARSAMPSAPHDDLHKSTAAGPPKRTARPLADVHIELKEDSDVSINA